MMFKKLKNNNSTVNIMNNATVKDEETMNKPINSAPSIISSDVVIKGNVSTSGEIQLDGTIEGDVKSKAMTIGENGTVKGKVNVDEVIIRGTVKGSIKGRNIRLEKTGKVTGDICHQTLSIEAGAFMEGNISHQGSMNSVTSPDLKSTIPLADNDADKKAHNPKMI